MEQLTTAQLVNQLEKRDVKLVDIRPFDAYNGWRLQNESRGGHITKAINLPLKWINYANWIDIVKRKGIHNSDKIIIYGYDEENMHTAANHFKRAGFKDINVYHHFLSQWCTDNNLPMSGLQRYSQLVSARWLYSLIKHGNALNYNNKKYVICHTHYRNINDYNDGHIPGAISLDTNTLESPETWNRRPPSQLNETFLKAGITSDTTVILYGRFSSPNNSDLHPGSRAGQIAAMRCAFIMLYAGVKDVRILNGGLQSWLDEKYELFKKSLLPVPEKDFGDIIPKHPDLAVDTCELKQLLCSNSINLVSIRSWDEYTGKVSGYSYMNKKGRIPGAIFGNCGSDAYHMENYRNPDNTIRDHEEIIAMWEKAGITPQKRNVFYCGTGWRASEAFIIAWLMGWPNIAVYDGGWFEWSKDPSNRCETGIPDNYHHGNLL